MSKKILFFVSLITLIIFSCEKDDICVEGSTPKLIIRFYDATNPTSTKTVNSLTVTSGSTTLVNQQSTDSIAIPLDVNSLQTVYTFTSDTTDDTITINYTLNEIYVSRSCGFIANYNQLSLTHSSNWIQETLVINQTIENEMNAHVQIRH